MHVSISQGQKMVKKGSAGRQVEGIQKQQAWKSKESTGFRAKCDLRLRPGAPKLLRGTEEHN